MGTETMTPVDATHVGPGGVAYKSTGASCWIWQGNLWSLIRDLPAQAVEIKREWTGEGLPPVGTVCEFRKKLDPINGWIKGEVVFSSEWVLVFRSVTGQTVDLGFDTEQVEVRAIRTAEQIAAEEREACIVSLCNDAGSPELTPGQRRTAERLIDAGWIKRS